MEQTVDLSPYASDGVLDHPLSLEIRVPLINTPYPRWRYITAVMVGQWPWPNGPVPTDAELRIVGSFHEEYCSYWYGPPHTGWRGRDMDQRPFDIDGGAVGRFLTKYEHGGWGYRISTWEYGPTFVPTLQGEPTPLVAVLDRLHAHGGESSVDEVEGRPLGHLRRWVVRGVGMAAAYGAGFGIALWSAFKAGSWIFDTGVGAWCRRQDRAEKRTA
jgi:hypothetical protein